MEAITLTCQTLLLQAACLLVCPWGTIYAISNIFLDLLNKFFVIYLNILQYSLLYTSIYCGAAESCHEPCAAAARHPAWSSRPQKLFPGPFHAVGPVTGLQGWNRPFTAGHEEGF